MLSQTFRIICSAINCAGQRLNGQRINCTEIPPQPLKETSIKVEQWEEFLLAESTLQSAGANFNATLIVPPQTWQRRNIKGQDVLHKYVKGCGSNHWNTLRGCNRSVRMNNFIFSHKMFCHLYINSVSLRHLLNSCYWDNCAIRKEYFSLQYIQ